MRRHALAAELACAVAIVLVALVVAPGPAALAVGAVAVLVLVALSLVPRRLGRRRDARGLRAIERSARRRSSPIRAGRSRRRT